MAQQGGSFIPFDDRPLSRADAGRCEADYRLQPLHDQLLRQLRDWCRCDSDGEAPRIGLFGGLGQGKTSLIEWVLEDMQSGDAARSLRSSNRLCLLDRLVEDVETICLGKGKGRLGEFLFGLPVARFDVSHFKTENLEWRFLTALLLPRILCSLCLLWLPLICLLSLVAWNVAVIWLEWSLSECLNEGVNFCLLWTNGACRVVSLPDRFLQSIQELPLLPPFLLVAATWLSGRLLVAAFSLGTGLYLAWTDRLFHLLARWTRTLPKIVVIDDLDRAQVEQQRAFLRALRRYSRQMGFALVVCMDESELLAAPANPDAPDELLRKLVPFELRLPERGHEDVVHLALSCCRQLAEHQPSTHWHDLILSPLWLADVVRCALLLGPPGCCSPRRIKHLLNDVLLRAEQLGLRQAGDCCALLRLECLLQLAPALRRHSDALLAALEANRNEDFERALRGAVVPEVQWPALHRFFARTRMMQPTSSDGWFRLVGGLPIDSGEENSGTPVTIAFGSRGQDLLRLYLATLDYIGQGYPASVELGHDLAANDQSRQRIFLFWMPGGDFERFQEHELSSALQTSYGVLHWIFWVAALTVAEPTARRRLYAAAEVWQGAKTFRTSLLRERLADAEIWRILSSTERETLLNRCPPDKEGFRLAALSELLPDDGQTAVAWLNKASGIDYRRATFWLAKLDGVSLFKERDESMPLAVTAPVLAVWPPAQVNENETRLPLSVLKCVADRLALPYGDGFRIPNSLLADWRVWQSEALSTTQCLDVLYAAAHPNALEEWSMSRLEAWVGPESGNDMLLPLSKKGLPSTLRLLTDQSGGSSGGLTFNDDTFSEWQRMTALALAVVLGWRLPRELVPQLSSILPEALTSLLDALFNDALCNDRRKSWLQLADPALVAELLKQQNGLSAKMQRRWQQITRRILRQAADPIFADAGWPPLLVEEFSLDVESQGGRFVYRPAEDYLAALAGLAKTGARNDIYRDQGIDGLRQLALTAADLPKRNRLLLDAWQLARGKWSADFLPDLFDRRILQCAADELRQSSGRAYPDLTNALVQVTENTCASFEEFGRLPRAWQRDPASMSATLEDAYHAWYRYFRDCLLLDISSADLEKDEASVAAKIEARVDWLRSVARADAPTGDDGEAWIIECEEDAKEYLYGILRRCLPLPDANPATETEHHTQPID